MQRGEVDLYERRLGGVREGLVVGRENIPTK
jgi:hypothetical protein